MPKQEATEERLREIWEEVEVVWLGLEDKAIYPWIESKFKTFVFESMIEREELKVPYHFWGA